MSIAQSLLPEFDHEMTSTRKILERVPGNNPDWRPHPKSTPIGRLAAHLGNLPGMVQRIFGATGLDINPAGGGGPKPPEFHSPTETLAIFDRNVAAARAALAAASDQEMMTPWSLKNGDRKIFTLPRAAAFRTVVMNHIIHHRGQMTVYLRMNEVPLPGTYGPSADEPVQE